MDSKRPFKEPVVLLPNPKHLDADLLRAALERAHAEQESAAQTSWVPESRLTAREAGRKKR